MEQLVLLDSTAGAAPPRDEKPWALDDHTRVVGRLGLEEARRALVRSGAQATARTAA